MANAVRFASLVQDGPVPGGGVFQLWKLFDSEVVSGVGTTVESTLTASINGFKVHEGRHFGAWVEVESGTAPNITVKLLESWDDTAGNYVAPEENATIMSFTAAAKKAAPVRPTPLRFLRLQLVGNTGNGTDTKVSGYLFIQT